jgi:uncharacterized protein YciI
MWYMIIGEDHEDSLDKRKLARPAHLERMQAMLDEGRVLLAGPFPAVDSPDPGSAGFTGSLLIVDFPTLEEAKAWADDDPYCAAGVYKSVIVKPFKRVLP